MRYLYTFLKGTGRVWFTGVIALLALAGYLFYALLWGVRFMQSHRRLSLFITLLVVLSTLLICREGTPPASSRSVSVDTVRIEIAPGMTLSEIAGLLEERGVIRWAPLFSLLVRLQGYDTRIRAGICHFKKGEGIFSAARTIRSPAPVQQAITIPEGLTIEQTARRFHEEFSLDTAEFLTCCKDTALRKRLDIPAPTLEGYLYPNTYLFDPQVTSYEVVNRMAAQFERVYTDIEFDATIAGNYARHEIVTLASIVEKEATVAKERPRISAVFHNRLQKGYPLGADPTVRYALRKFSGPLRVSELNNDSPYNTRKFKGLPPGPICSPGKAALQAAAAPSDSKELYFVAKWDGSGEHDFSFTNAQHEKKKREIRRKNRLHTK